MSNLDADDILKQMEDIAKKQKEQVKIEEEKEKEKKSEKPASKKKTTPKPKQNIEQGEEGKAEKSSESLEDKVNKLINNNVALQEIIAKNKIIEEKIDKLAQERSKAMIEVSQLIDSDVEEEIMQLIEKQSKKIAKKPFNETQSDDVLKWLAEKINADPKANATYLDLIQRLFKPIMYDTSLSDQSKQIIKYKPRKNQKGQSTGVKPGADEPKFRADFDLIRDFIFDQYGDLIQLEIFDYDFFKDLFEIYTRNLVKKIEKSQEES